MRVSLTRLALLLPLAGVATFVQSDESLQLFPQQHIYPHYTADPLRSTFSAQTQFYDHTTIADTSRRRFDLKIGGELLLVGSPVFSASASGWQVMIDAGFHGQFDADHSEDNIGWDGIYGMYFTRRLNPAWAWRFGMKHISSHVGDELMERTGRTRIGYTRQELRAGVAWSPMTHHTFYFDAGHGHDLRNKELQKPWRAQVGAEYENPQMLWQGQAGWYGAINVSSYEENDWDLNTSVQLGLLSRREERTWRLGLEFYHGRAQLGEFFQDHEQYLGLGLWIDI